MTENNISNIESVSNIGNIEIVGLIISILVIGGTVYLSKNKFTKDVPEEDSNDNLRQEISDKLKKLEESFTNEAISYYVRFLLLDSSMPDENKTKLLSKYKKVISLPEITWDNFSIIDEEGEMLNELLEEKLKDYKDKDKYTIRTSFNYFILEKSEKKAKEIIKSKEENV